MHFLSLDEMISKFFKLPSLVQWVIVIAVGILIAVIIFFFLQKLNEYKEENVRLRNELDKNNVSHPDISQIFRPLDNTIKSQMTVQLKKIIIKFGIEKPEASFTTDLYGKNRDNILIELKNIFTTAGYETKIYDYRESILNPGSKYDIELKTNMTISNEYVEDIVAVLTMYFDTQVHIIHDINFRKGQLHIRVEGAPFFRQNGTVQFN